MKKMKTVSCKDYYARQYFHNPSLIFVREERTYGESCPLCGRVMSATTAYVFKDNAKKEEIKVKVSPRFLECDC